MNEIVLSSEEIGCLAHCMSLSLSLSLLHKFSFDIISSSFHSRSWPLFFLSLSLSFSAAVLPSYSLVSNVFILICLPGLTSTQDKAKMTKEK
jgi:sugar phosphate permease